MPDRRTISGAVEELPHHGLALKRVAERNPIGLREKEGIREDCAADLRRRRDLIAARKSRESIAQFVERRDAALRPEDLPCEC